MDFQHPGPMMFSGPPPSFDELPPLDLASRTFDVPEPPAPAAPPARITRTPVRIIRARTGIVELRLLSERADGIHQRYVLERVRIAAPYASERLPLLSTRRRTGETADADGDKLPMSTEKANRAFDRAVASSFPDIELRPGVTVPTSVVML